MGRLVSDVWKGPAGMGSEILWYPASKGLFLVKVRVGEHLFLKKVIVR
jgi:hypothetical protein